MKYGLDFGTTNTSISIARNGKAEVLEIDNVSLDKRVVRSLLYFLKREMVFSSKIPSERLKNNVFVKGEIDYTGVQKYLIGTSAVEHYLNENKNRSSGIKRTIYTGNYTSLGGGNEIAEYYEEVDYGVGRLIQGLKTGLKSKYYKGTQVFGDFYSLERLISTFLKEIKRLADEKSGESITSVLVGRPVYFSEDSEKDKASQDRLSEALKLAGFEDIAFRFEPVAAAKQFINFSKQEDQNILVFDFGGGTLDTAIVNTKTSKVLATDGTYIGGDLLNADIMRSKLWSYFGSENTWGDHHIQMPAYIYEGLESWYSIPNLNNPDMMRKLQELMYKNSDKQAIERLVYLLKANLGFELYEAIEKAKKQLSLNHEAIINFQDGIINIEEKITKLEFEEIIEPRVAEIRQVVLRTLEKAKLEPSQIDIVVRTGGSSLIPVFENMLVDIFGKEKITQFETFTSISAGLALE